MSKHICINLDDTPNPDMPDRSTLHPLQRRYLDLSIKAKGERLLGYISNASRLELEMDLIYMKLPRSLRW